LKGLNFRWVSNTKTIFV